MNIAAPIPELPERAVRPLLRLAHLISGVEWTCGTMLGNEHGDLAEDCVLDATQREGMFWPDARGDTFTPPPKVLAMRASKLL